MRSLVWSAPIHLGLGRWFSYIARGRLPILAYHGFSLRDEHRFRPKLFMSAERFEQRMAFLARNRFTVLPLDEALQRLRQGRLREREIALTIDDGFRGVHAIAAPILAAYRFPATVYVTTYYVVHRNPVFRLVLQYMAWKSEQDAIEMDGLLPGVHGSLPLRGPGADEALERLYVRAERECDEPQRVALSREFAVRARIDYDALAHAGCFVIMSADELRDLARFGVDVQLHTHRHRLPADASAIAREIDDNRRVLAPLAASALRHFCYPSGDWMPGQWEGLAQADIVSATTCMPGFNRRDEPPLALRRFLDSDDLPQAEFAAEVYGVKDLVRRARGRRLHATPNQSAD